MSRSCGRVARQLRYTGHITKMPENRLPHRFSVAILPVPPVAVRQVGRQKKRFKDHLQSTIEVQQPTTVSSLKATAASTKEWRATCHLAVVHF